MQKAFTTLFSFVYLISLGQINPAYQKPYLPTEISTVQITISQADFDSVFEPNNLYDNDYKLASIKYFSSLSDSIAYDSVGFRLRGNTSRVAEKKSFKLNFESFKNKQELYGFEKLNLKDAHNDPSVMREILSLLLYRKMNVPCARTNHVDVYLNNEYRGLYVNLEQIDRKFLKSRFGNNTGNLYKCSWGASLELNNDFFDNEVYELKTNKSINDRTDLLRLASTLNHTLSPSFNIDDLDTIFNIDGFLRNLAVEAIIGHWDGYGKNQNNYYLFFNDSTRKFEFIPYDPDNTFGIDWFGEDWERYDIYNWGHTSNDKPLVKNILSIQKYRDQYSLYIKELIENYFNEDWLFPIIDSLESRIRPHIYLDPYYPLDYGFKIQTFDSCFWNASATHSPIGLKQYILDRNESAYSQLDEHIKVVSTNDPHNADFKAHLEGNSIQFNKSILHGELFIYALNGKLIHTKTITNSRSVFIGDVSPGFYVGIIQSDGQKVSMKVFR